MASSIPRPAPVRVASTRLWRRTPLLAALLVVLLSMLTYARDPAVPGNHGRFPAGWWGWWDQSQYILSARSLARSDLSAAHHWYPLGYAMLGAPFTLLSTLHPFLLPDLICLLCCMGGFLLFADAVGVGAAPASLLFLLASCGNEALRHVWAEPWNTTLSAALIWGLLGLSARHLRRCDAPEPRRRRFGRTLAIGALAGFMPVARPTDALLMAIWALGALACALLRRPGVPGGRAALARTLGWRDLAGLLAGVLLSLGPSAALWLAIYGPQPNAYMLKSQSLGFDFGTIGWRAYLLLIAPQPWFPFGAGLLQRMPWLLPGLGGIAAAFWIARGTARGLLLLLAAMLLAYCALFFAYVDLIPAGLWRYENVHYFKWTVPGVVLFGFLLLRALWRGARLDRRGFVAAALAGAGSLLLYGLRLPPHPVAEADPAWMVQVPGPVPGWDQSYFATLQIRDDLGVLRSINDFRALPDGQGWRLIALSRPFRGSLLISGLGHWPDGPVQPVWAGTGTRRWGRGLSLRLPCRLVRCTAQP